MVASVRKSRASGSSTGSPYCDMKLGSDFGTLLPPWQVKHVTRCAPPKNCLLIVCTIVIICRARWMRGVCVANADLSRAALDAWQKVQSLPIELANVPITSKKVSVGMPRSNWTVLKVSSTMGTRSGAVCARRPAVAARHAAQTTAAPATTRLAPTVIDDPPSCIRRAVAAAEYNPAAPRRVTRSCDAATADERRTL